MFTDRRAFMVGVLAVAACQDGRAVSATGGLVLRPEDFGARGDGATDDTAALQRCFDAAPKGAVVQLRPRAVYRVDTNYRPTRGAFGGVKLKSGQILDLNDAELRALPSSQTTGAVLQAHEVHGWRIDGPGRITGERSSHLGKDGEWGMGLMALASRGWSVSPGLEISNCWGDGIYVSGTERGFSEDFVIDRVHVRNCRRNGISIVAGRNGEIRSPYIHDIDGASPFGGIDLEPDRPEHPNQNIRIIGGKIRNVGVGVYVTVANEDVLITGMDIEGRNSGIIIGDRAHRVRIASNPKIRSTVGGQEGAAIRTVADPNTISGLHVLENHLSGGGEYVVDFWGQGYRDLRVSNNRITADNAGARGIARVGAGLFTDNVCFIGPEAGREGDYFIHLQTVSYGRNIYRSQSRHGMYSAIRGGREIAPDRFESPKLRYYAEAL